MPVMCAKRTCSLSAPCFLMSCSKALILEFVKMAKILEILIFECPSPWHFNLNVLFHLQTCMYVILHVYEMSEYPVPCPLEQCGEDILAGTNHDNE